MESRRPCGGGQSLESRRPEPRGVRVAGGHWAPGRGLERVLSPDGTNSANSLILGFGLGDCERINRVKPPVCGALLQQPQKLMRVGSWDFTPSRVGIPQPQLPLSFSACSLPLSLHHSLHPKAKTESSQGPLLISYFPLKEVKSHSELPEDDGWGEWGRVWEKASTRM